MTDPLDILGLGVVAVDDFFYIEAYPGPDDKTRVLRQERQCGGLTATALAAAARLGAQCAYAGVLGEDPLSDFVLGRLRAHGVDVSHTRRRRGARPVSSVIVVGERGGTRNIFYDVSGAVGAGDRWPPAPLLRSCRVLLVDHYGIPGMIRAARIARRHGIPVVADLEPTEHPRLEELLQLADHLIVSRNYARHLTGQDEPPRAVQRLWTGERQAVVVTAGERGCWFRGVETAVPRHQPAFPVKVVDTTGCGDVFHGAYAFGLARGLGLAERVRLATAVAALKATHAGGQGGLPSLAEASRLLSSG